MPMQHHLHAVPSEETTQRRTVGKPFSPPHRARTGGVVDQNDPEQLLSSSLIQDLIEPFQLRGSQASCGEKRSRWTGRGESDQGGAPTHAHTGKEFTAGPLLCYRPESRIRGHIGRP